MYARNSIRFATLILLLVSGFGCRSGGTPASLLGMNRVPEQGEPPIKSVDNDIEMDAPKESDTASATSPSQSGNMLTRLLKPNKGGKRKRIAIPRTDLDDDDDMEIDEIASKD